MPEGGEEGEGGVNKRSQRNTFYKIWRTDAILNGTTLQPTSLLPSSSFPSLTLFGPATHQHEYSLFDDISLATHTYIYIHINLPLAPLPFTIFVSVSILPLFVGSLIYNYDRQSEGSLFFPPLPSVPLVSFHSNVKAFRFPMLLEFQNLPHCLRALLENNLPFYVLSYTQLE